MVTLEGYVVYQDPVTDNSVIWLNVYTRNPTHKVYYHLVMTSEQRNLFKQTAQQDRKMEVTGDRDTSGQFYVRHFIVANWRWL